MTIAAEPDLDSLRFKLNPPPLRSQTVIRTDLINRLLAAKEAGVVTVIAPAGYGKTTLLAQWADRETRPVAWLSLDRTDSDPARLLLDIAAALASAGLISLEEPMRAHFASHTAISGGVPRLISMIEPDQRPGVLILDHVELARGRPAKDVLAEIAYRLDGRIQIAAASRKSIRLPLGTWRSEDRLFELGAPDLRMSKSEAKVLFVGMDVEVEQFDELMDRTEGWPVGLHLAGLALRAGSPSQPARIASGDDRYMADYVREQILSGLSKPTRAFLLRTSILDELSGPLCDAVLESTGSAQILISLEEANLPIVPLDRARHWYRYHHMIQDLLRHELEIRLPELVSELHTRASAWFEENGKPELAIHHAQASGDSDTVARLIGAIGRVTYARGQGSTVLGWLEWFESTGRIERYPNVAGLGALAFGLIGDSVRADRWTDVALNRSDQLDSDSAPSPVGLLVGVLSCRSDLNQMKRDAASIRAGLSPGSEWLPFALLTEALPWIWEGHPERAEPLLAEAITRGENLTANLSTSFALAQRSAIALSREDWDEADQYASRSLRLIRDQGLEGYVTSGLPLVVAARCRHRHGDLTRAHSLLAQAATLRPILNSTFPGISAQTLLEMAGAYLELSDVAGARTTLREAADILGQRSDLGNLQERLETMRNGLNEIGSARVGAFSLTKAELRLLPLLSSHLTFPQIGERLYISRHTVKTQAMSIYRKLGASSRSEAVDRARSAGFLNG